MPLRGLKVILDVTGSGPLSKKSMVIGGFRYQISKSFTEGLVCIGLLFLGLITKFGSATQYSVALKFKNDLHSLFI